MGRTRIKICGIRDHDAALAAAEAGADALGFMFVRSSKRWIDPDEAFEIVAQLPPMVASVGVFAVKNADEFSAIEERCPTVHTQLHGDEDEKLVQACGPAIKAVRFDASTIRAELTRWSALPDVEAVLVDGSAGGEGVTFDWSALAPAAAGVRAPLLIAGGLTPENVGEAIRAVRPFAVDVSSGVESAPGVKDPARIRAFCEAVRDADASQR